MLSSDPRVRLKICEGGVIKFLVRFYENAKQMLILRKFAVSANFMQTLIQAQGGITKIVGTLFHRKIE